jgi:hypothetical protein
MTTEQQRELVIRNNGPDIAATNYWGTQLCAGGLFYLTPNAGTMRLLMPPSQEVALQEMRAGRQIVLTRGQYQTVADCVELMFDDGSDDPYCLFLDRRQVQVMWDQASERKPHPFVIWTKGLVKALVGECHLRRTLVLPYARPLNAGGRR